MKQYELDLTLAFWFAVHLEDLPTAQILMKEEFLLKQLVACALINKPVDEDEDYDEMGDDDEIYSEDEDDQPSENWQVTR